MQRLANTQIPLVALNQSLQVAVLKHDFGVLSERKNTYHLHRQVLITELTSIGYEPFKYILDMLQSNKRKSVESVCVCVCVCVYSTSKE